MNLQEFIQKYNGKGIDFDGFYGFQCMDLYQQYNKEVVGGFHIPANASGVWTNYPQDLYEKIENTPNNFPNPGDVVIWNNQVGGGFGHIAVIVDANSSSFTSFDQNWPPGTICHLQNHNYNNVLGWLRPSGIIPPSGETMNDQTKIPKELLAEDQDLEIQQIRGLLLDGKRDNLDKQNLQLEVVGLKEQLHNLQDAPISADQYTLKQILQLLLNKLFK